MSLINELKRRNVFRVAIAYIVMAWLVMQVADVILNNISAPGWVFQVILLLLGIGFMLAIFFAWAFEMTPEGIKREKDVDRSQSITPQTGKKLNYTIFALMALAIAYFAYDKFVLDASRDAALIEATTQAISEQVAAEEEPDQLDKTIAVLPFVNMSSDQEQEFFSDGLSEELLNLLAKIPELKVTSRSSAFSFKGKDFKIADVGRELNVANVLEGSVRRSGNQIRVTAQLIRVKDDVHLWSETYDRAFEDVFVIQDEISAAVVEELKVTLLGEAPHAEKAEAEAYALYLRARHLRRLQTPENWEQAIDLAKQALEIDPDYVPAWIELGSTYASQAAVGVIDHDEGYQRSREAADKALAINPFSAMGHELLGWISMRYENDLAEAAQHYQRALQLEPANTDIIGNAAALLHSLGRLEESIALNKTKVEADPLNPVGHANLGGVYYLAGRFPEAIDSVRIALSLSPGYFGAHYRIGSALLFQGKAEAALGEFALESDEEFRVKGQALALHALGRQEEHQAKLDELIERWGDQWPSEVAHVYAYIGDTESAFQWLNRSIDENEEGGFGPRNRLLASLHDDPRWLPLLERVDHPSPEELAAIEFEVKLPK